MYVSFLEVTIVWWRYFLYPLVFGFFYVEEKCLFHVMLYILFSATLANKWHEQMTRQGGILEIFRFIATFLYKVAYSEIFVTRFFKELNDKACPIKQLKEKNICRHFKKQCLFFHESDYVTWAFYIFASLFTDCVKVNELQHTVHRIRYALWFSYIHTKSDSVSINSVNVVLARLTLTEFIYQCLCFYTSFYMRLTFFLYICCYDNSVSLWD